MSIADWRSMIPLDWAQFVDAWNEIHQPQEPQPPSWDEFQNLKAKYG